MHKDIMIIRTTIGLVKVTEVLEITPTYYAVIADQGYRMDIFRDHIVYIVYRKEDEK